MKRLGLILTTLAIFVFSVYLAFKQGSITNGLHQSASDTALAGVTMSPIIYTGFKGVVAKIFISVFNALMHFMGKSIILSIIGLALLVELVLIYPSARLQLKQKKIHIFHRKLIDRFNSGILRVSKTEEELYKLYDVNEKIHQRGALMVTAQIIVFFFTFWGLNLMTRAPETLYGTWNIFDFSILSRPSGFWLPVFAGLAYFTHGLIKIYFKQKEDYISPAQTTVALIFAVLGSCVVYVFSQTFAVALTVYFVTLITIATIRYILVEQHAEDWGKHAQYELIEMLKKAEPHRDRFEYFSRIWNHLPVVRHINFNLMEEALSMTLGLLLALSFFGAFQKIEAETYLNHINPPAIAQAELINLNI